MKVEKLSISLAPELGDHVRAAAERAGMSVSAWLANAAAAEIRRQAVRDYLTEWQAKHGPITATELAKARADLGYPPKRSQRT